MFRCGRWPSRAGWIRRRALPSKARDRGVVQRRQYLGDLHQGRIGSQRFCIRSSGDRPSCALYLFQRIGGSLAGGCSRRSAAFVAPRSLRPPSRRPGHRRARNPVHGRSAARPLFGSGQTHRRAVTEAEDGISVVSRVQPKRNPPYALNNNLLKRCRLEAAAEQFDDKLFRCHLVLRFGDCSAITSLFGHGRAWSRGPSAHGLDRWASTRWRETPLRFP
jgi:hypothetical protein